MISIGATIALAVIVLAFLASVCWLATPSEAQLEAEERYWNLKRARWTLDRYYPAEELHS